ncbi:eCIS core domain-containing protein [Taibaiella soli]|uniref:eCIS core domain-containing protein n=1 Tax=Taibaiella soli TaxID=1649169 RepID=A0A2W2BB25_9BACT|nr:DUF4157 domain-containing protein [Taibaiella soli]PZF73379.1 hypothetical protein DN068_08285 [Taibaiella soli]
MSEKAAVTPVNAAQPASQKVAPAAEKSDHESKEDLQFQSIQRKLTVGAADDPMEKEADETADKVMRMTEPSFVQRKCAACEDEDRVRLKPQNFAQRKAEPVAASLSQQINNSKGNGSPLPDQTKSFMESRFDTGFNEVRIHTDDNAIQMSRDLNAQAFAVGRDIYFNSGKFEPQSESGKHLLAHELTHTIQQRSTTETVSRQVTETDVHFRSFDQMMHITVTQFIAYVQSQSDWFTNPAFTDDQRERARRLLLFINDDIAAIFGYAGMWYVDMLINQVSSEESDANADALHTYASAMSASHMPFTMSNNARAMRTAIAMGNDMIKLRQEFQDYVLHDALDETQFLHLHWLGFVDDVVRYHRDASQRPTFQASDGKDFESFISFNRENGRNPLFYDSTALRGRIRNFHRFQKRALDKLVDNYGDTSKSKPLTLILHSALDHNGAFHRDPNLTAVITAHTRQMLTLMIEGFEHLSDYQALVRPLASTYGRNNLIDQVMFAGHGNAQIIEMAGTIREDPAHPGHIDEVDQSLRVTSSDPAHNDPATMSLLREVRNFMANPANGTGGMSPHNRVVFNACLTGSNSVSSAVTAGDVPGAQTEIVNFINTHPSLSMFMQQLGGPGLQSVGANGSFGTVGLIDRTGTLDILSEDDPQLTDTKLRYTETGTEPTGALRAALESWAHDAGATRLAMERRVTHAANDWDSVLIKKAYQIVLARYMNDAEHFRLVGSAVELLSEMKFDSIAQVGNDTLRAFQTMDRLNINADAGELINAVLHTPEGRVFGVGLALLQVWMTLDANKQADFMTAIGAHTCNQMVNYIDVPFLESKGLMNTLLTGAGAAESKLRLALLGILGQNDNPAARTHLNGILNGTHFPAGTNVTAALGGASTELAILTKLGAFVAPGAPQMANVHADGAARNTIFVERLNTPGTVENPYGADVHEAPDDTSALLAELNVNDPVDIIGHTGDWYAIDFMRNGAHTTAYVSRWSVRTLSAYIF